MKRGFSLIELSVVIVIIGLLVGVLVAARSIRNTAQVQATISDFGKYKQAALQYKEKYYYLPGDDPNAANVWSGTTSGNGDGGIDGTNGFTVCSGPYGAAGCLLQETFTAPQDLAKAGFITGNYSGAAGLVPEINYIPSIMPKSACVSCAPGTIDLPKLGFFYVNESFTDGTAKNVISLANIVHQPTSSYTGPHGNPVSTNEFINRDSYVSPADAYAMDQKIDDGNPNTGYIRGISGFTNNDDDCATDRNAANATYAISDSAATCIVDFTLE